MNKLTIRRGIVAVILLITVAACGGPAATPPQPATDQTSSTTSATPIETAASPTPPLAVPSPTVLTPTLEPTTVQETPTPEASPLASFTPEPSDTASALLPRERPWAQIGTTIYVPGTLTVLDVVTEGDPATVYHVVVAPDGSALAYVGQIGNSARLIIRDTLSGESQVIGDADGNAVSQVRFSPDSQSVAYAVVQQQRWQLNVWDRVRGAARTLQEGPVIPSQGSSPYVLYPVAWTPAGLFVERIIYASDAPPQGLALIDLQSGEIEVLRDADHLLAVPTNDGTSVALMVGQRPMMGAPTAQIIRLSVEDRSETELTAMQTRYVKTMAWSPDSKQLLYTTSDTYESRETTLHLLQGDGSNEQTLVFGQLGLLAPLSDATWQDATTMLVLLWDEERQFELHALPISSFDMKSLRSLGAFDASLDQWQPVRIAYVP